MIFEEKKNEWQSISSTRSCEQQLREREEKGFPLMDFNDCII
jgi:hypothetical protein